MAMLDIHLDSQLKIFSSLDSFDSCRDRYGWFNVTFFHMWACSQCYNYLFPEYRDSVTISSRRAHEVMKTEGTLIPSDSILFPDLFEGASIKDNSLCESLGQDNCKRLTSCCAAAVQCCSSQVKNITTTRYHVLQEGQAWCPKTWDGFACFEKTAPGKVAQISCPTYIDENIDNGIVGKRCTENGTWETHPVSGTEWTDYSNCVSLKGYRILYYVCIICNGISLLCLVPSCIIFIKFKQLRKQHRIRIHLNLFVSFILTSCAWLSWDHIIFRDRMDNPKERAIMHKSTNVCKILYVISRYSWMCNCVWMSLEGFHLYRLINHAFKAPKSIKSYYFIGWLFPLIPICVYSVTRVFKYDEGCWVSNANSLEWIMYGPILLCILVNVAFLTNILRILLTQIQSHPNEPSNYRRALKATFILIPLFGLQLFLIVYRPNEDVMGYFTYEVIARIISNSQGAAVATVFCFLNSEVHSQFRAHVSWIQSRHSGNDIRSCTFSTEMRRTSGRDTRQENIPMTCPTVCHGTFNGNIGDRKCNASGLSLKWHSAQKDGRPIGGQMV